MKTYFDFIKEAHPGATEYLTDKLKKKDPSSRPNPEPRTKERSLSGIPPLPKLPKA